MAADELDHGPELGAGAHGGAAQVDVLHDGLHEPVHLGPDRHAVDGDDGAGPEEADGLGDDVAAGAVDDGVEVGARGRELRRQLLVPPWFLVGDAALGAEAAGALELGRVAGGDVDVAAHGGGELEDVEGDAAADAGDEDVAARGVVDAAVEGLGDEGAPAREADEREGGGLVGGQVGGGQLDLVGGDGDVVLGGAGGRQGRGPDDAEGLGVLGAVGRRRPPAAGGQHYGLADEGPGFRAGVYYGAVAVGQHRVVERYARVQVLPDEEVPVVQGRGVQPDQYILRSRGGFRDLYYLETTVGF